MSGIPTSLYTSDSSYSILKTVLISTAKEQEQAQSVGTRPVVRGGSLDSKATCKWTQQLSTLLGVVASVLKVVRTRM